jgi:LuxR family maltose regulon positive regulatory protein
VAEAETSLLKTKLSIPPVRPALVSRPRLVERLQEGLNYNLTLVSAPAGFGKTTLLSEWARQDQPRVRTAWFSLDEGDNDPTRFWDYFIAALQTLQPTCGEGILPLLHSSQPPPTESMLTALINDLSGIAGDFIIVLDDYHHIESQQIHNGITYMLEHMPGLMHMVIATRADPPLPLARARGRGAMLEIGADDLRFTLDEAISFLKEMRSPELSNENVSTLNKRTEGWAVGLKMAALSMRGKEDIPEFITAFTGSQRYVMDYLMEEVLLKQTQEVRDFLLKTSVLERLSGPLCDAVTGRKGSQDILLNLERGHLFIVPLDESHQWYRYEHLFADLLLHQCESTCGKEQVTTFHQQASQWYEGHGFPDEAIHHALAAQDWETATRLISEYGKEKEGRGEFVTLLNWTQRLPEEFLLSHPRLCLQHTIAIQMAGSLDAAESKLKILEKAAQDDDSIKGEIAAQQAHITWRRYDYPLAGTLARKALSLLSPDELESRATMNNILGYISLSNGNFKEAESLLTESYEAFRRSGSGFGAYAPFGGLMTIMHRKGELGRVAEMCQQAIELAGSSPASLVPHISLSAVLYEWNDLEGAVSHIQQAIEMGQLVGTMQARMLVHDTLAGYRTAQGDKAEALKALEKADLETRKIGDMPTQQTDHAARRIQIALRQEDLAAASEWSSKLAKYAGSLSHRYRYIPLRLLIAQGNKNEAAETLQVRYKEAVQWGLQGDMVIYRLYQALAAETEESALEFLSDALTMAEPEGYIRTFVDEGKLLKPLLEKALSREITPEYTRKLITIIEAEERHKRKIKKGESTVSPYQSLLSQRELEVLRLMAEGLSNQQIADRLIISLSTAKNHVHNILEKLNVQGRTQAVTQARELELI